MIITVKGNHHHVEMFKKILMEQHRLFRLYNSDELKISFLEQKDTLIKFNIDSGISVQEISSLKTADFRFYTTEIESIPLIEFEKAIEDLYDFCIYQSDSFKRYDPELSKMFNNLAKSFKRVPEEWIKVFEYEIMSDSSFFEEEEVNQEFLKLFRTIIKSELVHIPIIKFLYYYRDNNYQFPSVDLLSNDDDIFYIAYDSKGPIYLSWRNLISALNLSLDVEDEEGTLLLKI